MLAGAVGWICEAAVMMSFPCHFEVVLCCCYIAFELLRLGCWVFLCFCQVLTGADSSRLCVVVSVLRCVL